MEKHATDSAKGQVQVRWGHLPFDHVTTMVLVKIKHHCQGKSHAQRAWKPQDSRALRPWPFCQKYLFIHLFILLSISPFISQAHQTETRPWGALTWRLWSQWIQFLGSSILSRLTSTWLVSGLGQLVQ